MRSKQIFGLLICLVAILALAACKPATPGESDKQIIPRPKEFPSLGDTYWTLQSLGDSNNMTPALPGRTVTLNFYESGSYMGSPGYTGSYGGAYKTEWNIISIYVPTVSAVSPPDDPPGFLEQNQTYFALLSQAQAFKITGNELLINCKGGKALLFYGVKNPSPAGSEGPTAPITIEPSPSVSPWPGSTVPKIISMTRDWQTLSGDNTVLDLLVDGNAVWAATPSGVIFVRWDLENWEERKYTIQDGLASDKVRKIIRDSQGDIWVTCSPNGVSRFDGNKWDSFSVKNGLCSNDTIALAADKKGGVWVSAYWGVSYFNGQEWSSYSNISTDAPVTGGENPMRDCRNLTFVDAELAAADVIFVDSRGDVWFSSRSRGITRYNGKEWQTFTEADGLAKGGVNTIFEDKNGTIWFDSHTGITRLDGPQFIHYANPAFQTVIPRPIVQDILQDKQGNLWLAAYGGGVAKFDGKEWQTFTVQDGLPSINAQDLFLAMDGYPGVITEKGVSRFDGSTWQVMTTKDGLPEGRVRMAINDDQGNLWLGGEGRVSRYSMR